MAPVVTEVAVVVLAVAVLVDILSGHTNTNIVMFPPAGVRPQRLQHSSRSGHENDPDRLHSAGPGVPETGPVREHVCVPFFFVLPVLTSSLCFLQREVRVVSSCCCSAKREISS